jgi:3',5'-cyclic AMP phosphodiesterase CpdA
VGFAVIRPVRVHLLSDLHLEQDLYRPPAVDADLVVLAGDVARGTRGVEWARRWARGRPVAYVAGNHEFYGHTFPALIGELRQATAGSPVYLLENDEVTVDGVRFLGCTLWSDFDFGGPEHRADSMRLCAQLVNDYEQITYGPGARALQPRDTRMCHVSSRRWLETQLAASHEGPTVVVTHHAPIIRSRPLDPRIRALAGAFASDLTALMGRERVSLWTFGHTHRTADLDVRGTRVVSNPRGYAHEPVMHFDPARVIEL